MDERCDYLANLLYRGAGLTVKDASVVPGGVRMAGRTFSENDARVGTNASSGWTDRDGLPGTFDSEADGMSGYVRRVTADPGSDVRVNRAGSVIVEDNTFDSDAKALRDSEYVPRVYSKDKPDARAGYEDGASVVSMPASPNVTAGSAASAMSMKLPGTVCSAPYTASCRPKLCSSA